MEEDNLKIWRRTARSFQQTCSNSLGDRLYDKVNEEQLAMKVGYALYNEPTVVDENNKTAAYTKTQQNHIALICEKMKSLQPPNEGFYYFSCIYIVIRLRNKTKDVGVQVLFRIPQFEGNRPCLISHVYLDPKPRKYDSWDLYLKKNKLPKCDMCYPKNGVYTETDRIVDLTFAASNACATRTAIFNGLDISSTVLLVGATGVSLASLALPIAAPVVWGATATFLASGSYDAARKVYSLHDIKKHGESIGLKNPDARSAWLNLAGSVVGMASIGTTAVAKSAMAAETAISRAGIITLRVLNVSSLAVNGVGVLNGIVTLVMKRINGTLDVKDILQFTAVCFFFLNAIVTYNMASNLIEEMDNSDMKSLFNLRENSAFQITKSILKFNDLDSLKILQSLISGVNSPFSPNISMDDHDSLVLRVLVLLMKFSSDKINFKNFSMEVIKVFSKFWKRYQDVIFKVIDEVKNSYNIPYWQRLLPKQETTNLEVPRLMCEEIDRVIKKCGIVHHSAEHRNLMTFAKAYSHNRAKNDRDFINRFKFYCDCIVAQFREELEIYEDCLDTKCSGEGLSRDSFDKSYGIQGRMEEFLFATVVDKVNNPDFLKNIDDLYNNLPNTQTLDTQVPFIQTMESKIYTFCDSFKEDTLEDTFYWNKASELTGFKVDDRNCTFNRQDSFVLIKPKPEHSTSEVAELEAILINTSFINESHMGLLLLLIK